MNTSKSSLSNHWGKFNDKKRFGVSIPIHALHSQTTYGIGEYLELIKLFPWLKSLGISTVQLHPINDNGEQDNPHFPYSPFALNPLFLSLTEIPHSHEKHNSNLQKTVLYSSVEKFKKSLLVKFFNDHGQLVFDSRAFTSFCEASPWLDAYLSVKGGDPKFHQFVQFLCHRQMEQVKNAANQHGILLIGEIATRLSTTSPDVIYYPNLFKSTNEIATCVWKEMEKDHFSWWMQRLRSITAYFDCCKFDAPFDSPSFLQEIEKNAPLLTIIDSDHSLNCNLNKNICPVVTYPQSTKYPAQSLTELVQPTVSLTDDQYKKLIKDTNKTDSLLHLIPLHTYLSLVPEFNCSATNEKGCIDWTMSFKPSVEEIINNDTLREVIIACLD